MVLKPDDMVAYAAIGMPEDEFSGPNGGDISPVRAVFASIPDNIYIVTGVPALSPVTMTVRVKGGGKRAKTQTGGGTFDFSDGPDVIELLKVISNQGFSDDGIIGSVTVGVPIAKMKSGDTGITAMFIDAFAEDAWGSNKSYFMKFFWKNASLTDSLSNALIQKARFQTFLPPSLVSFSLESVRKGNDSTPNRLSAPSSGAGDDSDKKTPNTDMQPGDYTGVWLTLNLRPQEMPGTFQYKTQCTGQTAAPS